MVDAVEEAFDVDIHDPVISPASLTRSPDRVDRGTSGSISIRIRMEHRFQQRLQVSANNLLPDTVRNRRNPQRPRPSGRFRYVPSAVRFRSSPWTSPDGIRSRLFRDAHHHRSLRQQLAVVWHPLLIAGAEGPTLISHTAPHLHRCWCVRGTQWSAYLLTSTCASSASVAMPPSIG